MGFDGTLPLSVKNRYRRFKFDEAVASLNKKRLYARFEWIRPTMTVFVTEFRLQKGEI